MTRILVPTTGQRRYNDHLHIDFFLSAFARAGLEVIVYGPGAEQRGARAPLPFDAGRPMASVVRELDPDVYFTLAPRRSQWATHHGIDLDVPKVLYHCDLHYARDGADYRHAQLLLVRAQAHLAHVRALPNAPQVRAHWLPFSVAAAHVPTAQPVSTLRDERVYFAGATDPGIYPKRELALGVLAESLLLARDGVRSVDAYMHSLTQHALGLTCSSRYRLDTAKHLEIPAAGALLLTDGLAEGLSHLLPDREMYMAFEDARQLRRRLQSLLQARTVLEERAARARAHVLAHHTDARRGEELIAVMKDAGCLS
jgi:hypothetical protein